MQHPALAKLETQERLKAGNIRKCQDMICNWSTVTIFVFQYREQASELGFFFFKLNYITIFYLLLKNQYIKRKQHNAHFML